MTRFQRRDYTNRLTELIGKETPLSLDDFLLDLDLPDAVRNESSAIIAYLQRPDPNRGPNPQVVPSVPVPAGPYLHTLVDYALSDIWQDEAARRKWPLFQTNRNAATVLSQPFRRLWTHIESESDPYVLEKLIAFPRPENKDAHNSVFAGHFQRIIENFLTLGWELAENDTFFRDLVDFCIRNVDILPYQQILCHYPIHFPHLLERVEAYADHGDMVGAFLLDLLRGPRVRSLPSAAR
jgi:hypothetical protein